MWTASYVRAASVWNHQDFSTQRGGSFMRCNFISSTFIFFFLLFFIFPPLKYGILLWESIKPFLA